MIKKAFLTAVLLVPLLVWSDAPTIKFTPYESAAQYIGKGKPVMLEIGAESCVNCKKMNDILAPIMAKYPHYQIFDILLKPPAVNILDGRPTESLEDKLNIHAIPVQIFYDASGKEIYRHTGILEADQLMKIFKKMKF